MFFKSLAGYFFLLEKLCLAGYDSHRFLPRLPLFPESRLCSLALTSTPLYLSLREHKDSFELCNEGLFFLKFPHGAKLCPGLQHCDPIEQSQWGYVGIAESVLALIIINRKGIFFPYLVYKGPLSLRFFKATS